MKLAKSKTEIKRRVDRYLWESRSRPLLKLRKVLGGEFLSFGSVAVVGGLIRDLAQVGSSGFKSDVDLVIDEDPNVIKDFARSVKAIENRFGGFRYTAPGWNIDFWALKSTWASVEGHVHVDKMHDLLHCTFFTSDALIYVVNTKDLIVEDACLRDLLDGRLEINLLPNPSIYGNLLRAVRRALARNMSVGPRLANFIDVHLSRSSYSYLVDTETRLYGFSYAKHYQDPETLRMALFDKRARDDRWVQYSLPL